MANYFKDRATAGAQLAQALSKYRFDNTAVLALSPDSVLVAEQIAAELHAVLMLLLIENVQLSESDKTIIGTINPHGEFTYNNMYSAGEIEELTSEYHESIEQGKFDKYAAMHRLLGEHGIVDDTLLYGRKVILVSSGLKSGMSIESAVNYLKPIKVDKIIAAVPVASVEAADKLHILTDEIHCLSVVEDFFETNHYYDKNDIPSTEIIISKIDQMIKNWR